MIGDQLDAYQMLENFGSWLSPKQMSDDQKVYALNFAAFTKEYFKEFEGPSGSIVFSTICNTHAISVSSKFWTMKTIQGVSQSDALNQFLTVSSVGTTRFIDDCKDKNALICNKNC